ncbi:Sm domain-containing protein [Plasmodiophora brassicae]|uniref:Sm domain-containing protein n=1 Tax=Plasmodiophora brassicae TaxID=37360 RepID=A0A0G4J8Q4_PLABS|nr:hypothetical protein PBRA_009506 [Plasmodiophora brassicae]SPQ99109.1 unnamed protein product [Plasmodiophora brassicae]
MHSPSRQSSCHCELLCRDVQFALLAGGAVAEVENDGRGAPSARRAQGARSPSTARVIMSKKESVLDLNKHLDQPVLVKFAGGREVTGILKGYDPLVNIVLDETVEYIREADDPYRLTDQTRNLGLTVCRGTAVMLIAPVAGSQEIDNPFVQNEQPSLT